MVNGCVYICLYVWKRGLKASVMSDLFSSYFNVVFSLFLSAIFSFFGPKKFNTDISKIHVKFYLYFGGKVFVRGSK